MGFDWKCVECKHPLKYEDVKIHVNKQRLEKCGTRLASKGVDLICRSCSKGILKKSGIHNENIMYIEITWGNRMVKYRFYKLDVIVPFYHKIGTPVLNVLRTTYKKLKEEFAS